MPPSDAYTILDLWEEHRGLDAIRRSASLCAAADPAVTEDAALDLPLGDRNAGLLRLRSTWSDDAIEVTARCPRCDTVLEFNVEPVELLSVDARTEATPVETGERTIRWRPVTSADLLHAVASGDTTRAERILIGRCVTEVIENGREVADYEPTTTERASLAKVIVESDPLCEVLFAFDCAECARPVTADLQIPTVVWNELSRAAQQLVDDVHRLASAYGWSESDCLALSPERRTTYLQTVGVR